MTAEETKKRLTEIFIDIFNDNSIVLTRQTTAADIDDWDSLAQISLVVAIEKEFKIQLELGELKALQNVGDMLDVIERKAS